MALGEQGALTEDNILHIHEGSPALHYGQQCFEGLKAYRRPDGGINLFRPDENSKRLNRSARRLRMPFVPEEMFLDAVNQVVKANQEFVPPYGTGATLYLRPLLIGVGENIGVAPAPEYLFIIFACRSDHISKASWPQRTLLFQIMTVQHQMVPALQK